MDEATLAAALRRRRASMPEGNKHTALFLFGIEHAEALSGLKINTLNQIALAAGLKGSRLGTEIRKAVNLAPYVRLL